MSQIHFIEGPVGAGKSTYAKTIAAKGAFTHIALDEWFARLFSPDRPQENQVHWYVEQGATFSMVVPDHIFEMASTMWEPPDELELEEYDFVFPASAIKA